MGIEEAALASEEEPTSEGNMSLGPTEKNPRCLSLSFSHSFTHSLVPHSTLIPLHSRPLLFLSLSLFRHFGRMAFGGFNPSDTTLSANSAKDVCYGILYGIWYTMP